MGTSVVTDGSRHVTAERRRNRAHAVRISVVLAGILNLATAAVLIGVPGSAPTLDAVPVPESDATAPPPGTISARPTSTPIARTPPPLPISAPRTHRGKDHAEPGRGHTPPPGAGTRPAVVRPTPAPVRPAPVSVRRTPRGKASATARPGRTNRPVNIPPAEPSAAASPKVRHTPPGQTREPPGQGAGKADNPGNGADPGNGAGPGNGAHPGNRGRPDVPPGLAKK